MTLLQSGRLQDFIIVFHSCPDLRIFPDMYTKNAKMYQDLAKIPLAISKVHLNLILDKRPNKGASKSGVWKWKGRDQNVNIPTSWHSSSGANFAWLPINTTGLVRTSPIMRLTNGSMSEHSARVWLHQSSQPSEESKTTSQFLRRFPGFSATKFEDQGNNDTFNCQRNVIVGRNPTVTYCFIIPINSGKVQSR